MSNNTLLTFANGDLTPYIVSQEHNNVDWLTAICNERTHQDWDQGFGSITPLKINRSPENQWLEDDSFPFKMVPNFRGRIRSFFGDISGRFSSDPPRRLVISSLRSDGSEDWTAYRYEKDHSYHSVAAGLEMLIFFLGVYDVFASFQRSSLCFFNLLYVQSMLFQLNLP